MFSRGRKTAPRTFVSGGNWQAVYSPFALIVLTLFILLASFSVVQANRAKLFSRGFASAVSVMDGGLSPEKGQVISAPEAPLQDKEARLAAAFTILQQQADLLELQGTVDMRISRQAMVLTLSEHLLFPSGSARLDPASLPLLAKVARLISASDHAVLIKGHSDDQPIATAQYPSNWELSTARAVTVLRYFSAVAGIDAKRLGAAGYGEYHPLAANDSPNNRARNRRVEIVFLPGTGQGRR